MDTRDKDSVSLGLTHSDRWKCWLTHQELGAEVYTIEEGIRHLNRHTPANINRALVVNRQVQFLVEEFNQEWTEGRRVF